MYHNRFNLAFPLADAYEEVREGLRPEIALSLNVQVSDLKLNLKDHEVYVGLQEGEEADGGWRPLGDRARSVLYERLGLGRVFIDGFDDEERGMMGEAINHYVSRQKGGLTLKVKQDTVIGVVTDRYFEIPYMDSLAMMEHLGARPIRIHQNDNYLTLQAVFEGYEVQANGEKFRLGVQMRTSDMGVGSLGFEVFALKAGDESGCVLDKRVFGSVTVAHVKSIRQAEEQAKRDIPQLLASAVDAMQGRLLHLAATTYDPSRIVDFFHDTITSKKMRAHLVQQLATSKATTNWDVFVLLMKEGSDGGHSQSMQFMLEEAAGRLLGI